MVSRFEDYTAESFIWLRITLLLRTIKMFFRCKIDKLHGFEKLFATEFVLILAIIWYAPKCCAIFSSVMLSKN